MMRKNAAREDKMRIRNRELDVEEFAYCRRNKGCCRHRKYQAMSKQGFFNMMKISTAQTVG